MRSFLRTTLTVAGLLLASSPLFAQTQTIAQPHTHLLPGDILVPSSSIQRPEDVGKRMHTNTLLINPNSGYHNAGGLGPGGGMTPNQMYSFYGATKYSGGQIIAIVDAFDYPSALNDFNTFSAQFGLPQETSTDVTASTNQVFQIVYAGGSKPYQDASGGWESEEALDIEWAHAMAPYAKIVLVEANSDSDTDLNNAVPVAAGYTDANGLSTKEVSMSWGGSEFSGENTLDSIFTTPGVVYFASTGDNGTAGGTEYPSTSPNVVAVGGTTVNTDSNGKFVSESGWSGSGGGPSSLESRPYYQGNIQNLVGAQRGVPDISADADPATGASIYDSTPYYYDAFDYIVGWSVWGGTSLAAPMMAGLVNGATSVYAWYWPGSSQRQLDVLYINQAISGYANLRDITSGSNGGYSCLTGWDFVTGIGTPINYLDLRDQFSISSLSPSSAIAYSDAFTLTVNGGYFDPSSVIHWNGTALPTTWVNYGELQAAVPASDLNTNGRATVTVSDAGDSATGYFTVSAPMPTLSKLSPTSVLAGGPAFTLTVTSTVNSYVNGSTINWNGTALATTFVSPKELKASVPANLIATHGSAKITVYTPGGGTSAAKSISIKVTSIGMTLNSLVQNGDGSYTANVTLTNIGYNTANNLEITASSLGAAGTSDTLPISIGNMPAGAYVSGNFYFPSSAGAPGQKVTLKVVNKFTGGSSTDTLKVTLP